MHLYFPLYLSINDMPNTNKIIPITRSNKWFSEEDFELEVEMGREAIEGDGHFTVILYRVDRENTISDIYGEANKDEVRYKTPVELLVMPILAEPENIAFNKSAGTLRDLQDGQLTFYIYQAQLVELNVEISFGDYIGYPINEKEVRFFSVANDGIKNYDNKHTIMGYKGAFRIITCAPIDEAEFRGL